MLFVFQNMNTWVDKFINVIHEILDLENWTEALNNHNEFFKKGSIKS